jgi:hypothetical protein
MTHPLYAASVPAFLRHLRVVDALIDKARAAGMDEQALMEARLAPDMRPFADQVRMAAFGPRAAVARLTGRRWPSTDDSEASLDELKATLKLSIDFIEGVPPEAFEGSETRAVELKTPATIMTFEGAGYLTSFALPNFYFHVTIAYAILRHLGLEIGKRDYLGQLQLSGPPVPVS